MQQWTYRNKREGQRIFLSDWNEDSTPQTVWFPRILVDISRDNLVNNRGQYREQLAEEARGAWLIRGKVLMAL